MEQTGRIIEVMEPKSGKSSKTGNPWMIQEYVLEIPGQYPRRCMFSIYGEERIKQMNVQMGEDLTIQYFASLSALSSVLQMADTKN